MSLVALADRRLPHEVRAFFTEFDRDSYANIAYTSDQVDELARDLERKVKLLALIKGRLVIPASHLLESELAREFLQAFPQVVEHGIVAPSLRDDVGSVDDFLRMKLASHEADLYRDRAIPELAALLDTSACAVRWNAEEVGGWLKERLLADLSDSESVLRLKLATDPRLDDGTITKIRSNILAVESVSRATLIRAVNQALGVSRAPPVLDTYVDYLYYLSGAIAVAGEGILPQNNLVRVDLISGAGNAKMISRLSEYEIFFRIFMHVVRLHTQRVLPDAILDELTFDDIAALRRTEAHSLFVTKYDAVGRNAKQSTQIHDVAGLALRLEELEQLEWELRRCFSETIAREAAQAVRRRSTERVAGLVGSIASTVTFYGVVNSVIEIVANSIEVFGTDRLRSDVEQRTALLGEKLEALVDRRAPGDRDVLLRFLAKIADRYRHHLPE